MNKIRPRFRFIILFLLTFFIQFNHLFLQSNGLNECGGTNEDFQLKLGELCETNSTTCPFGFARCRNENALVCVPRCNISLQEISEILCIPIINQQQEKEKEKEKSSALVITTQQQRPVCLNNGYYLNENSTVCMCSGQFTGDRCENVDPCFDVNCNQHGICSKGVCVCDFLYTGAQCHIRRDCQADNFYWTGKECICSSGFIGKKCDRCAEDVLCVPLQHNAYEFATIKVLDQKLIDDLLIFDPPPGYHTKPFKPTIATNCQCLLSSSSNKLIGNIAEHNKLLSTSSHTNTNKERDIPSYNTYVHHYYQHHFRSKNIDGYFWASISITVLLVFILLTFIIWKECCVNNDKEIVQEQQQQQPMISLPPSLSQPQSQIPIQQYNYTTPPHISITPSLSPYYFNNNNNQ